MPSVQALRMALALVAETSAVAAAYEHAAGFVAGFAAEAKKMLDRTEPAVSEPAFSSVVAVNGGPIVGSLPVTLASTLAGSIMKETFPPTRMSVSGPKRNARWSGSTPTRRRTKRPARR